MDALSLLKPHFDKDKKSETAAALEEAAPTPAIPPADTEIKPGSRSKPAPLNPKSYRSRLGLARALRVANQTEEAQKYYEEVIHIAPEVCKGGVLIERSKPKHLLKRLEKSFDVKKLMYPQMVHSLF